MIESKRFQKSRSLLVFVILLLLPALQGCKSHYSKTEAVRSILQKIDFPREGGSWKEDRATVDIWVETGKPSEHAKGDPLESYKAFAAISERCYSSLMSTRTQPEWFRVAVYSGSDSSLTIFTTPFSHIARFQRGQIPPNNFWNFVAIDYSKKTDRKYSYRRLKPEVNPGEYFARLGEQASSFDIYTKTGITVSIAWSDSTKMFLAAFFTAGKPSALLRAQAVILMARSLERTASKFGFAYNGLELRERYSKEYKATIISRDVIKAAVRGSVKPAELIK